MTPPTFDEIVPWLYAGEARDVVMHRNPQGDVFAWHSPLDDGAVRCSICEGGARVYMNLEQAE